MLHSIMCSMTASSPRCVPMLSDGVFCRPRSAACRGGAGRGDGHAAADCAGAHWSAIRVCMKGRIKGVFV